MVRLMGNSTERVPIKDLGDVIYYKQIKEFSDAELETSRDLNREIKTGRIILLEQNKAPRGSEDTPAHAGAMSNNSLTISDLKAAMREMLPELKGNGSEIDLKGLVPLIQDAIRSEMAKMPLHQMSSGGGGVSSQESGAMFKDAVYTPVISSEGLTSNLNIQKVETSGDSANEALAALRNLNRIKTS
jgi:hypothetical protein